RRSRRRSRSRRSGRGSPHLRRSASPPVPGGEARGSAGPRRIAARPCAPASAVRTAPPCHSPGRLLRPTTVGVLDRVEDGPQYVALEFQRLDAAQLLFVSLRRGQYQLEEVFDVLRLLREPIAEVRQALGLDPRVVLLHVLDPLADQARREELG